MVIRDATAADVAAILDIRNALIATTTVEWRDEPIPLEVQQAWFAAKQERGDPVLVADDDGRVAGYTSFGPFDDHDLRPGYRGTVELTVHVAESHWRRGIASSLLTELEGRARDQGRHVLVAGIDGENEASIRLHERHGFVETARMPEVGREFGRWLDLVHVQKILD